MNSFVELLLKEINYCRTNPKVYAEKLLSFEKYFKDKVFHYPNQTPILTTEGFFALKEAADLLFKLKPLSVIKENYHLSEISNDVLKYNQASSSNTNYNIDDIINSYGKVIGAFSQAIDFGSSTPELVIINLLADDGDLMRCNRENVLNNKFKIIGIANNSHKIYKNITVLSFARHFFTNTENVSELSDDNYEDNKKITSSIEVVPSTLREKDPITYIEEYDEDEVPDGVVKIERIEREILENGIKRKITKITKLMDDGSTHTEIFKSDIL